MKQACRTGEKEAGRDPSSQHSSQIFTVMELETEDFTNYPAHSELSLFSKAWENGALVTYLRSDLRSLTGKAVSVFLEAQSGNTIKMAGSTKNITN